MDKPLVSVCMITYNHEPYISKAIEGVLMQKANFPIELIIGEDCSTDNTRNICIEYQKNHPDIIRLQLPDKNKGMMLNFIENMQAARGKYIALCEGDDYWTDPLKLQKQVDFLEANTDYGFVYTNAKIFDQVKNKFNGTFSFINDEAPSSGVFFPSILLKNYIQTLTVLVKKEHLISALHNNDNLKNKFKMGDYPLWIEISRITKIKYINQVTAVYRKLQNSASSYSCIEKRYDFLQSMFDIQFYFCKKYELKETLGKIEINYVRFLCNKAFNLNQGIIDKHIIKSFKPMSIQDRLIKLSLNNKWVYKITKICFRQISCIKKMVSRMQLNK